jgi:hypothetical protein
MIQDKYFDELQKFRMELINYIRNVREQLQRYLDMAIKHLMSANNLELDRTTATMDNIVMELFELDRDLSFLILLLMELEIDISRDFAWDRIKRMRE